MDLDPDFFGAEHTTAADREPRLSSVREIRDALYRSRYYLTWGDRGEPPLPTYEVTLWRTLRGIFKHWHFQNAAVRTVEAKADMRWGHDGRGFRRLLHPNGVCLIGRWKIDADSERTDLTGYFAPGKEGLLVARYSTCCTETRRGRYRSLSMVGNIYPTLNPEEHCAPASFITQQDIGGEKTEYLDEAILRNTPNTTPWNRGHGVPVLMLTAFVLFRADKSPTARQVYPIAELGHTGQAHAPQFLAFQPQKDQPRFGGADLDFRDEVLSQIYNPGDLEPRREWKFDIRVSEEGRSHLLGFYQPVKNWKKIGTITFQEAFASYNGDFVFHVQHPPWRNQQDNGNTIARQRRPLF
jgi:hypothetical protein